MKALLNNSFRKVLFAILFVISFGCTEVIDVELNSSNPKIVIEGAMFNHGNLVDENNGVTVSISKTIDYFNPIEFPKISDAIVRISDSKGNTKTLIETNPGVYKTNEISSNYGEEYTLNIEVENKIFSAKSKLVEPLILDSISYSTGIVVGEASDIITLYFQDNPDKEDYAQVKVFVNGKLIIPDGFELYTDQYENGKYIDAPIVFINDSTSVSSYRFKSGDQIDVELVSFNKSAYSYFFVLDDLVNVNGEDFDFGGKGIPDNPPTNLSNDALGFFGAYSISRKSIVIN